MGTYLLTDLKGVGSRSGIDQSQTSHPDSPVLSGRFWSHTVTQGLNVHIADGFVLQGTRSVSQVDQSLSIDFFFDADLI